MMKVLNGKSINLQVQVSFGYSLLASTNLSFLYSVSEMLVSVKTGLPSYLQTISMYLMCGHGTITDSKNTPSSFQICRFRASPTVSQMGFAFLFLQKKS